MSFFGATRVPTLLALLWALPAPAFAQNPAITSAPVSVTAGPDFASDVLNDPWDMANAEDLGPFPDELGGWTISDGPGRSEGRSAFVREGQFVGRTTLGGGSLVPLLFRGGADFITSDEVTGKPLHRAIPTDRYGKLAVKMTLGASTGGQVVAVGYSQPYAGANEQARGLGFSRPRSGTHIYIVDLVTGVWTDERGNPAHANFFGVGHMGEIPWNGVPHMRGFQLRPTSDGHAEVDVHIDWVRLTQRDHHHGVSTLPLEFDGCSDRDYNVEVRVADDTWDVIHTGRAGLGVTVADVNYGVLAPGRWDLRVTCFPASRAPTGGQGVSSDHVTVHINAPPAVAVLNPDVAGSGDFAAAVLQNPWDMDTLSDVAEVNGVTEPGIVLDGARTALQATATSHGDPIVALVNGATTIDTSRFRNLTFTLTLDTPFGLDGRAGHGSVARVFWGTEPRTLTTTQDIMVWPGRNTYTMDLATLRRENGGLETECPLCRQMPWTEEPVTHFRIDPHESTRHVTFRLGPVFLSARDEVAVGGSYDIEYAFADIDREGSRYEARLYLDRDRDVADKTLIDVIATEAAPDRVLKYRFDPGAHGIEPGDYFVYVEITEIRDEQSQSRGAYSTGPLVVTQPREM